METILVGIIGVAAVGYIGWRVLQSSRAGADCESSACNGCNGGCGCSEVKKKG